MFKLLFTSFLLLIPVSLFAGLQTFCTGGMFPFKFIWYCRYDRKFVGMGPRLFREGILSQRRKKTILRGQKREIYNFSG